MKAKFFALFVVCLMAAIALRAIIPAGFMPDIRSDHPFKMVICSMDGPKTLLVDQNLAPLKDQTHHDKPAKEAGGICSFSINNVFASVASLPFLPAVPAFHQENIAFEKQERAITIRFFGNASSRSPPVTVI